MPNKWTAEITNDPDRNFELYIELLEEDEFRARIGRDSRGELILGIYPTASRLEIPLPWLLAIGERALQELGRRPDRK